MCKLLGMCLNLLVKPDISFRESHHRVEHNPDGWGITFYPDEFAQVIKEEISAKQSDLSKFLQDYQKAEARIFFWPCKTCQRGSRKSQERSPVLPRTEWKRIFLCS